MATISYEVYKILEEKPGKEKADKVVKVLEESFLKIEEKAREQKPILKAEVKEELLKELVTKEELMLVKLEIEKKIDDVKAELERKIDKVKAALSRRIDKIELLLKVLIGLVVLGITFLNPAFVELIKIIFNLK
ncbi:MAG: hypothetical protein RMK75_07520 [Aquificaceae bacterium]|nr:hypothetical protein [Aquificaceae bacterium]MDW8424147.1 hypothetical protein [Aquificaceae bacterium]